MDLVILILVVAGAIALSSLREGRKAADAPALLLGAGLLLGLVGRIFQFDLQLAPVGADAAAAGLAVLGFTSAAQMRVSRLAKRCPSSFRLTFAGAPLYFTALSLSAFVILPELSMGAAVVLGVALMLNGAAFDRKAVMAGPAPAAIKAAVRYESAAIIALGLPVAVLCAAAATAPGAGEPALTPLLLASLATLKGFAFGGVAGLLAAALGAAYRRRTLQQRSLDGLIAISVAILVYATSPLIGAEPIVAVTATGLLWGEQTSAAYATRLRLRRFTERSISPLAYFGFGMLLGPRILEADLLATVFAVAAVTILRAGPRLAILTTPSLPPEARGFLAWFGGAPGAASALFLMTLMGNPALMGADDILIVGSLAVTLGVIAARMTSGPLIKLMVRQTAIANRRRQFRL